MKDVMCGLDGLRLDRRSELGRRLLLLLLLFLWWWWWWWWMDEKSDTVISAAYLWEH
jgi:hypothetical protein